MRVSVILAHPDKNSFNHAIAGVAVLTLRGNGHEVIYHDLYAEGFDPILPAGEIPRDAPLPPDVQRHCDEIAAAGGIVVIHPNWWGQPPAILKGWADRVIRPGVAYEFREDDAGDGVPVGLLKAGAAVVLNTSNTYPEREQRAFGDPLQRLWEDCVFDLCGVGRFYRRMFCVVVTSTPEVRRRWLEEAAEIVGSAFPPEA
jgi:putative NADPH-quinone reductase